ncbi:hypothetical protein [Allomuricauda sp. M10]|jgi:hypothetical protein|uniref:hypothetical protein n=1 Tax=Allomuricauda sp. M10 TaxID=2683292 RepID=UPI001D183730|nr:hypothetical protein [Muricauda sp. M10]
MSFPRKTNSNRNSGAKVFEAANGLDDFLKTLEKDFFASAKVQCKFNHAENRADLILDLHLNFGLIDCLRHFNNGDWGGVTFSEESQSTMSSSVEVALKKLNSQNNHSLDILELSLHFAETSIIISRLYEHSIVKQLGPIISGIGQHFVYFTKGLTEMPYEIFVPVFEDTTLENPRTKTAQYGYFDYWGLYFENQSQHEAMIYSLNSKKLEKEDLFLFE